MNQIEFEKTYLLKFIPNALIDCEYKKMFDFYLPQSSNHPILRIRQKGNNFEITKKYPIKEGDASSQIEHTISLSREEFEIISSVPSKKIHKDRYFYNHNGQIAEIDVFKDDLSGLVVADFEFENEMEKNIFIMPDFCLAEVTQEDFIAGGMLCGKKYADIKNDLERYGYKKLFLK